MYTYTATLPVNINGLLVKHMLAAPVPRYAIRQYNSVRWHSFFMFAGIPFMFA